MPQITTAEAGKILPFVPPPFRFRRPAETAADGRGAILLFTGVRYERPRDDASGAGAERRPT